MMSDESKAQSKIGTREVEAEFRMREGVEEGVRFLAAVRDHSTSKEESILDLLASGLEDDPLCEGEPCYDATLDLPNPGEIVEENDSIVRDYVTKLNFVARPPASSEEESALRKVGILPKTLPKSQCACFMHASFLFRARGFLQQMKTTWSRFRWTKTLTTTT